MGGYLWQADDHCRWAPGRLARRVQQGNLTKLTKRLRSDAILDPRGEGARGADAAIPFIVGTMSRGDDDRGMFSEFSPEKQRVDDAHRNIPNLVPFADTAVADDSVPPAYPCGQGSCIHFGAAAYRELDVRYFEALRRVQQNAQWD